MNTPAQKAQILRINRRLARRGNYGHRLCTSRSERELAHLGQHYVIDLATNGLVDYHVNLDSLEQELNAPTPTLSDVKREAITFRLVERFSAGIYPAPQEFSDEEIACIAGWAGDGNENKFPSGDDDPLIEEYRLDVGKGENTYPAFAAVLKKRKMQWEAKHPAESNLRRGEHLLEKAVENCAVAGMSAEAISRKAQEFCELVCV